jgi:uncharacterized protein YndB with AHSA1/START domain
MLMMEGARLRAAAAATRKELTMTDARAMQITTPTAREVMMTRVFDAPRKQVFDAYTQPTLLRRWLGVFKGWTLAVCEIDLRAGGRCRYEWRGDDGRAMGMTQLIEELEIPERIVANETFDDPWYEGDAISTVTFEETDGRTTVTLTIRYDSNEIRDNVLAMDVTRGMSASFDNLANVLETMEGGERVRDAGVRP